MTAENEIKQRIKEASKNLNPSDKVRWRWGFVDGLKEALKIIQKHKEESNEKYEANDPIRRFGSR